MNIPFYSNWDLLNFNLYRSHYEIAIMGDDFEKARKEFDKNYLPTPSSWAEKPKALYHYYKEN
jgi:hypothetical protein